MPGWPVRSSLTQWSPKFCEGGSLRLLWSTHTPGPKVGLHKRSFLWGLRLHSNEKDLSPILTKAVLQAIHQFIMESDNLRTSSHGLPAIVDRLCFPLR